MSEFFDNLRDRTLRLFHQVDGYAVVADQPTASGQVPTWDGSKWVHAASSGGSGSPLVRKFPFAYNTPGLLTGHAIYTPTIGDILIDAWMAIQTPWNGTTPFGDAGPLTSGAGWFGGIAAESGGATAPYALNMTQPERIDISSYWGTNRFANQVRTLSVILMFDLIMEAMQAPADGGYLTTGGHPLAGTTGSDLPNEFTTTDPIKVVVSQDGTPTGSDPGSTQGAAVLYLVTATPV